MSQYRIVCTTQVPVSAPTLHAHIVNVGTGDDPESYSKYWTLAEVLAAMDNGDTFYTIGVASGQRAEVKKVLCPSCPKTFIIRSARDAVKDNNLDSLRICRPPTS